MTALSSEIAASFARLTLGHIGREYPNKLDHVLDGPHGAVTPRALHPIFFGSFDWHSCVHGWWQLLTIARLFPNLPEAEAIRARAGEMLVAEKMAGELAYLDRASARGFERPYGWAWALALHSEASRHDASWSEVLAPLARSFAARFKAYLPLLTYPIRTGTHSSTAFALLLALDWGASHDAELAALIAQRAERWFAGDRDCQAWEPGGDEFLSAALCEATLMTELADAAWFDGFLPNAADRLPTTLFAPAHVSDRTDGKIAHLDGLNLSRAWCWRRIARKLGPGHAVHAIAVDAADRHLAAGLPHIAGDYAGEHWLASFALLALLA